MTEVLGEVDVFAIEKPRDECGVVAVVSLEQDATALAVGGISTLHNRGKDATGVAVLSSSLDGRVEIVKGLGTGLVVFGNGEGDRFQAEHPATQAVAHARYRTQGGHGIEGAQPFTQEIKVGGRVTDVVFAHNGNLTNTQQLAEHFSISSEEFKSDSELMSLIFAGIVEQAWDDAGGKPDVLETVVAETLPLFEGAFTGVLMVDGHTFAFTDRNGLKPGVIGRLPDGGIMVGSEVTSLDAVGATFIREIKPAELITVNTEGEWHSQRWAKPSPAGCLLELLYVIKPHGKLPDGGEGTPAVFHDREVAEERRKVGRILGEIAPIDADLVIGVPNSALLAAEGYAEVTGIKLSTTAMKAKTDDRSFIASEQQERKRNARDKLEVDPEEVRGKRLVVIDDSLIRGTTSEEFVQMLWEAGAAEVHLVIGYGPFVNTCDMGMDVGSTDELIAANMSHDEIVAHLNVTSLHYLSEEAIKTYYDGFCTHCITGEYPFERSNSVPVSIKAGRVALHA